MHKMRQTNELQASLDFASGLEEAENSCEGMNIPRHPFTGGSARGPLTENCLHGYHTSKQEVSHG